MRQNKNLLVAMLVMAVAMLLVLAGGLVWFILFAEPIASP